MDGSKSLNSLSERVTGLQYPTRENVVSKPFTRDGYNVKTRIMLRRFSMSLCHVNKHTYTNNMLYFDKWSIKFNSLVSVEFIIIKF